MTTATGPIALHGDVATEVLSALNTLLDKMSFLPTSFVGQRTVFCLLHLINGQKGECFLSVATIPLSPKGDFKIIFQAGEPGGRIPFSPKIHWILLSGKEEKNEKLRVLFAVFYQKLQRKYLESLSTGGLETEQNFPPSLEDVSSVFGQLLG